MGSVYFVLGLVALALSFILYFWRLLPDIHSGKWTREAEVRVVFDIYAAWLALIFLSGFLLGISLTVGPK